MNFYSMLSIAVLALSPPAWAAEAATTTSDLVLPAQLGRFPVSIYDSEVKTSRTDPLAPVPQQLRRLMVTVYRPFLDTLTCPPEHQSQIPYAAPVVAAAILNTLLGTPNASSVLAPVKLLNCSRPVPDSPSGPLLLFSPGYAGTHHGYASTLQAAASSGYTVVAIDHTYESAAVVFPDGAVTYTSAATDEYDKTASGQNFLHSVRMADAVSVLDAIERGDVPGLGRYDNSSHSPPPSGKRSMPCAPPLRAVMYGHSFGGSTAVNVAATDARVLAAINIDGFYYGPVAADPAVVRKPLLMMRSAATPPVAAGWSDFFPAVHSWKTWVIPNGTAHYGYTDLPLLADLLGLRGAVIPPELVGTVDSRRLQEIVWRYTLQFFAYVLREERPDLLEVTSAEFPDVEFVGHAEAESEQ